MHSQFGVYLQDAAINPLHKCLTTSLMFIDQNVTPSSNTKLIKLHLTRGTYVYICAHVVFDTVNNGMKI
jgi:hypothetical protein